MIAIVKLECVCYPVHIQLIVQYPDPLDVRWNVAAATVETDAAQFTQIRDILIHHE